MPHLFTSPHLAFRNWLPTDIDILSQINSDPLVMEFFSNTQTVEQTVEFIERMKKQFSEKGFCYFAVNELKSGEMIGFIGLNVQSFVSDFTPCVDIGWRLKSSVWNRGYATEGAKRCLEYGFEVLNIPKIYSIAPAVNVKSERIMQKIGMKKVKHFVFPALMDDERLRDCILYEIDSPVHDSGKRKVF